MFIFFSIWKFQLLKELALSECNAQFSNNVFGKTFGAKLGKCHQELLPLDKKSNPKYCELCMNFGAKGTELLKPYFIFSITICRFWTHFFLKVNKAEIICHIICKKHSSNLNFDSLHMFFFIAAFLHNQLFS